mgnify:CR=1 FL=1
MLLLDPSVDGTLDDIPSDVTLDKHCRKRARKSTSSSDISRGAQASPMQFAAENTVTLHIRTRFSGHSMFVVSCFMLLV